MDTNDRHDIDLGDTPAEEGVSEADAAERVDQDPEAVPNYRDQRTPDDVALADDDWPEDR